MSLAPGTPIHLARGFAHVESLAEAAQVLTYGSEGLAPRPILPLAYRTHRGSLVAVTTTGGRRLCLTREHPVFYRFQATARWIDVVLGWQEGLGYSLAQVSGRLRGQWADRTFQFRAHGGEPSRRRRFWILSTLARPEEASLEKAYLSCRYGVPDGETLPARLLEHLLQRLDTDPRGRKLLQAHGLDAADPHWIVAILDEDEYLRQTVADLLLHEAPARHTLTVAPVAAGDTRGSGLALRDARSTERFDDEVAAIEALRACARNRLVHAQCRIRLGRLKPFMVAAAGNLRPGFAVPAAAGDRIEEDMVQSVEEERSSGFVYDLRVDARYCAVAGGLVVGLPWGARPGGQA